MVLKFSLIHELLWVLSFLFSLIENGCGQSCIIIYSMVINICVLFECQSFMFSRPRYLYSAIILHAYYEQRILGFIFMCALIFVVGNLLQKCKNLYTAKIKTHRVCYSLLRHLGTTQSHGHTVAILYDS